MKKIQLVSLMLVLCLKSFAFDYRFALRKENFENAKYNFSIIRVIDGRLNKLKPVGSLVAGFSSDGRMVGNDSIEQQMTEFFKNVPQSFNSTAKVIMVINQINMQFSQTYRGGKKQELEFTLAVDYYLDEADKTTLLYQQFFIHKENVTLIMRVSKAIDVAFSETVRLALIDLKFQLDKFKIVRRKEVNKDSLMEPLASKPEQRLTSQNVRDGIYFSCKDLYLNRPGILDSYSVTDSTLQKGKPSPLKADNYVIYKSYAIVRDKHIFIYITDFRYEEAQFSPDGKLYFPDVTTSSISKSARIGAAGAGVSAHYLHLGFLGGILGGIAKSSIRKAGTTATTSDLTIDFESGDLIYEKKK